MHKFLQSLEFFEENERKKLAIFIALEFPKLSGCHQRLSPIASICMAIEKKEKYYYIVMIMYVHSF
jgi:hypothetical protein